MDQSIYTEVHWRKGPRFQERYLHCSYDPTHSITVDQTLNTKCPDPSVFAPTHGPLLPSTSSFKPQQFLSFWVFWSIDS